MSSGVTGGPYPQGEVGGEAVAAFKDNVDEAAVRRLAGALQGADPAFPAGRLVACAAGLEALELKARVAHVAGALGETLSQAFPRAAGVVSRGVGASGLGMWEVWPVTHWVAQAGLHHPDVALPLLAELTGRASAEFAIRPFIDAYPPHLLAVLGAWVADPDENVRRLVSEGTRPRLPWAARLRTVEDDPAWAVPLLDRLHADRSLFVRRSVANHLNDLSKIDAALALAVARRWADRGAPTTPAVLRHGLRALVKAGDREALRLVGADVDVSPAVTDLLVRTPTVALGGALEFSFTVSHDARGAVSIVVDYAIHHRRQRGTTSRKVFKLRTLSLGPGETAMVQRRHRMDVITTRRYYPGMHALDVQCNGQVLAEAQFELTVRAEEPGARGSDTVGRMSGFT